MATVTEKLHLTKPDVNDQISPTPMNDNMDKIEDAYKALTVDYVIAQGVQGDWLYRRWNNGMAEAWYEKEGDTGAWKWWSTKADWLQYSSNPIYAEYPISFITIPKEFASATCAGTDCWVDRAKGQTTARSSTYWLTTQGDALKTAGKYTFNLYVVGRWK